MEFSGNSLNQPVNFYTKNTGNTINMAIDGDKHIYSQNVFAPEFMTEKVNKTTNTPKKKRKSKRLNTLDCEYLPDEASEIKQQDCSDSNFFVTEKPKKAGIRKALEHFVTSTPLVNYFFMRKKKYNLEKTVETLNDINQNVDELLNTAVPYGEASNVYTDIARNLTSAANIIGKANREM